ncbi:MAG TPA: carbohydrate binding domain-containing protein [Balneolaceae bacterium]|nr:carbohydrate binding domain-containing protein [Balneolaceae bacterium]
MVWKSVISDVGIKLETASGWSFGEIKVANTVTDQWEELTFDFSDVPNPPEDEAYDGITVFPDFQERAEENVIFFDNITFSEAAATGGGTEGNLLSNGDFSDGINSWVPFIADFAGVSADVTVADGEAAITNIAGAGGEVWHVQLNQILTSQQIDALEIGESYTVSFDARSSANDRQLRLFFGEDGGAFTPVNITDFVISNTMETFDTSFTVDETFGAMKFGFEMGLSNEDVFIDNVSLELALATSVEELDNRPNQFSLDQNFPNPFNPTTNITFTIPQSSDVKLEVFNALGQKVATLVNGSRNAGSHTITFDASRFASGVYLYRLTSGNCVQINKMLLLK